MTAPTAPESFEAVVFDLDGVLIDTERSFTACVLRTAALCAAAPGLGSGWNASHVEELRLCGGFNDDIDASAAIALEGPESPPGPSWSKTCRDLRQSGGGPDSVRRRAGDRAWETMLAAAGPVFQSLYAGPRAPDVYGVPATEPRGLYEEEVALVRGEDLEALGRPWGIFTGRSPGETVLGLQILEVRPDSARIVCATQPKYRKPRPEGLIDLAAGLKAKSLLFVGDNLDDLQAARNARAEGLDVGFAGVAAAGSPGALRFAEGGAWRVVPHVKQLWSDLIRRSDA